MKKPVWNKGIPMSDEAKVKASAKLRGRKFSDEHKRKISKALKWKKKSKEHIRKIKERMLGKRSPFWKGGRGKDSNGYWEVYSPHHPYKNCHNRVKEHRLIMEKELKRFLTPEEHVHHINEDIIDNRIENLKIVTREEHNSIHKRGTT